MIRRAGSSYSDTEIEFPLLSEIHIDRWDELLLLIPQRIESGDRSCRSVILQPAGNPFRDVITELRRRREFHTFIHTRPVERPLQRRIESQIPLPNFSVDDRTNLPRPGV